MKLQLTLPTGFTAEPLPGGQRRYVIPRGLEQPLPSPPQPAGGAGGDPGSGAAGDRGAGSASERSGTSPGDRSGSSGSAASPRGAGLGSERSFAGPDERAGDALLLVRESLPLPLGLEAWPLDALSRLTLSSGLLPALPGALAAVPAAAAAQWRVRLHSARALSTAGGWPATLVHAAVVDGRDQHLISCIAALYRFLSYGAEAIFLSADPRRFAALREPLLHILATGRPIWPRGEPPSLHHMLYDEPESAQNLQSPQSPQDP